MKKGPYIREISGIHTAIVYDENAISRVFEEIELVMTKIVIPKIEDYNTKCQCFFNQNEEILNDLRTKNMDGLAIDLSVYNDECKSAYLDFSMLSNKALNNLKPHIMQLIKETDVLFTAGEENI